MLKKYSQFFLSALIVTDTLVLFLSWVGAYVLRFHSGWFPEAVEIPPWSQYLMLFIPIWIIVFLNFRICGLYRPLRGQSQWVEYFAIFKSTTISFLIIAALLFFYRQNSFSRLVIALFWLLSTGSLILSHSLIRNLLMALRRRGKNLRHILIAGEGPLAQELVQRIELHPEMGLNIVGFVTEKAEQVGSRGGSYPVLGTIPDLPGLIRAYGVDKLFVTMASDETTRLENILEAVGDEPVDIKVVPDLLKYMRLSGGVDDFDGLPIVNLVESPLYGWNMVIKRATDIVFSIVAIMVTSPLMAVLALLIKLESKGPVLYVQERVGMDRRVFKMYKFRSMYVNSEAHSGPVWTPENDSRRTRIGVLMRTTSLDELPQFFNVLRGDMSLVGPRPERPMFIDEFRESVPNYMLRLHMKAGITGWAQIHGWRGNTDLKIRIEHDMYYIQHWSWLLDMKIILLTLWKGMWHCNAY